MIDYWISHVIQEAFKRMEKIQKTFSEKGTTYLFNLNAYIFQKQNHDLSSLVHKKDFFSWEEKSRKK